MEQTKDPDTMAYGILLGIIAILVFVWLLMIHALSVFVPVVIIICVLLGVSAVVVYYVDKRYKKTVAWLSALTLKDVKNSDLRDHLEEAVLDLPVPFDRAFRFASLAVPGTKISSDPATGIIRTIYFGQNDFIIATLEKKGDTKTQIHVGIFYLDPYSALQRGGRDCKKADSQALKDIIKYLEEQPVPEAF
jgi:hypothetical protein